MIKFLVLVVVCMSIPLFSHAAPEVPIGKDCGLHKDADCNGGVCAKFYEREDILCDGELCSVICKSAEDCPANAAGKPKCVAMSGKKICMYSSWDAKYCGGD